MGPLMLESTGRHELFLKSTCDMVLIDMNFFLPCAFPIRQTTFGYFKTDMEITKITTGDIAIS